MPLEKVVSALQYFRFMTTKRRGRIKSLICPECGALGTICQIMYGMPDPEIFDFEKYAVGGCCTSSIHRYLTTALMNTVAALITESVS